MGTTRSLFPTPQYVLHLFRHRLHMDEKQSMYRLKSLRNGPDKNDSTERRRTFWNAKKVLTLLLSVLTSDWLKHQKLKLHKAVHIFILTFQP